MSDAKINGPAKIRRKQPQPKPVADSVPDQNTGKPAANGHHKPPAAPAQGDARKGKNGAADVPQTSKLTDQQKQKLAEYVAIINRCQAEGSGNFYELAFACHRIQSEKLYVGHKSEAAYFKAKFGFSRSHSLRLAKEGGILDRLSPLGDRVPLLTSDSHLRPLLKLSDSEQDAVLKLANGLARMAKLTNPPAKLIAAAVKLLAPTSALDAKPKTPKIIQKIQAAVQKAKAALPAKVPNEVSGAFASLEQEISEIAEGILRSTGISWTHKTWNPLHGCTRASEGCDLCYAAKLMATRLADIYPGLAIEKISPDGKKTYVFTGKIALAPETLADPLNDLIPKMYFVNSMSDLFHVNVVEEYIEAIFDVMEKASWHTYQVLTKRPERMAEFTQKRYRDRTPPSNIWLGTSTENQAAFDERMPHLKNTKAAVRWLSIEPLIGPVILGSADGIDWTVVGGESGEHARPMKKEWATAIRDECKTLGIPFFFKQWGVHNEQGIKAKERKSNGPVMLDGVVHDAFPVVEKSQS